MCLLRLNDAQQRNQPRLVRGFLLPMHPVLKNAIENPRIAQPYGSDPGDIGYSGEMGFACDRFIKANIAKWSPKAANDNYSRRDYRAE